MKSSERSLRADETWSRSSSIAYVENATRVVLLELTTDPPVPLVLEDTALAIWQDLEDRPTTLILLERLAERFGQPVNVIEQDVRRFLSELLDSRVVVRSSATS
ncbi:PqqD family protein [Rathayibacter sp. SD072]|uniref:PqqD family protein n=1 Tax=Rathayibacter sp. SD072 TaxID=2781731 RepID=UPI001A9665C5|nr:PqqD family protein [Rathayibacter sp. SD072]MBO0982887.1 PqqD family protein [Rathayibacter sp. SD072]